MEQQTSYKKVASHEAKKGTFNQCLLLYSGGLDTSVILPWLKDRYPGVKLVAFAAELGQGDELAGPGLDEADAALAILGPEAAATDTDPRWTAVRAYLEEHAHRNPSREQVAWAVGMHPSTLSALCRRRSPITSPSSVQALISHRCSSTVWRSTISEW